MFSDLEVWRSLEIFWVGLEQFPAQQRPQGIRLVAERSLTVVSGSLDDLVSGGDGD